MVAQSRRDRTSTVIPGVAIATALIPPLCTAGFGIATGQLRFFLGALYLFFINTVFIAMASFLIVRFLKYERKVFVNKARERKVKALMFITTLIVFIPSLIIGIHMVRMSVFEAKAENFVAQVFNFRQTRVIERSIHFKNKKSPSQIELLLVGEPLSESVIENARAQMVGFGLDDTELTVRQAGAADQVDWMSLQQSYVELLDEKNHRIERMQKQLEHYRFSDLDVEDISREAGVLIPNLGSVSLTKGISFDPKGSALDTMLVCVVSPLDANGGIDREKLMQWLRIRTNIDKVKIFIEQEK